MRRKRGQSDAERHHVGTRPAGERPGRPVVRARPDPHVAHGLGGHARPGAPRSRRQASVGRRLRGPHPPRVQGAPLDQGRPLAGHGLLPDPLLHPDHGLRAAARPDLHAASPRPLRAVGVAHRGLRVGRPGRHHSPHDRAPARRAWYGRRGGPLQRRPRCRCCCGRPGRHSALVPDQAPPARLLPARPGLPFPGFDPLAGSLRRVGHPHRVRVRRGPARPRIRALQRDARPRGPRDRPALPAHRLARRALRGRRFLFGRLAGERDRAGQRPQGPHLHDLADGRRHPDRHGRRLAPLRRDPQPVHPPQRRRHEVPGTGRPHAHRRQAGHQRGRLRRRPRGHRPRRGHDRRLLMEGPPGPVLVHRVRPLPGAVPRVEHPEAPLPQAAHHGPARPHGVCLQRADRRAGGGPPEAG